MTRSHAVNTYHAWVTKGLNKMFDKSDMEKWRDKLFNYRDRIFDKGGYFSEDTKTNSDKA